MQVKELRRVAVVATLLVSAVLAGCATAAKAVFKQPDVTFRGIGVRGVGLDGAEFDVMLSIYNPNSYSLGASALRYELLVDSVQIGAGQIDSAFNVASGDTAVLHLPVRVGFRAVQAVGPRLLRSGEIPYRLRGDVSLKTFVGTFQRSFNEGGRFDAFKAIPR
jgi:LEA14-like dessication related protein